VTSQTPRPSEDRYRLLVEAVTDYAIYMLNPDGIIVSWNPGAKRFKGYEESEVVGQHFSRFYTDEDRASGLPQRALATAAREGKFESEGWRVRKDGSRFWAYVIIDPIRDDKGGLIGFAKVTRDLTERREAEEILRRNQEQFRILVQGVTDYAIYFLDPEGKVASWNAGAQKIKGYAPDEIIGQHFSRFYTQEDLDAGLPARALETVRREGRFENEGFRVRKDGTKFWANVVIDALRDPDGNIIGFAKITRDITERKEAEKTLEKTRDALLQAQKMEAIGQLTGGVAHDFNNLLMAIQGSLELLKRRLPSQDARAHELLDNAMHGATRGSALTQRMLAFARRQELKFEEVDIVELIREMTGLLQSSLGPSVQIETRFPLSLPQILADPSQLELAILNLAMNARDAMPDGGPIVIAAKERIVTEGATLKPGKYICLSVTDTGSGMNEETVRRAMDPFFTTKGIGKGTGLGLPMVHGMAEQSGGKLYLKSTLGAGTTAELCLPAREKEANKIKMALVESPGPAPSTRALKILSVDDDPLVAFNTTAMLADLGHEVYSATNGSDALDLVRREKNIDLIITDQAMPGMTGVELAKAVHAERPTIPILIATGYAEVPESEGRILPKLPKPFFQADLASAIASIFEDRGLSAS
jgi:PAS domain S-box-containing protein